MARFVRLEPFDHHGRPVWVNPEHVTGVADRGGIGGGTMVWVLNGNTGFHVLPGVEDVVDMLGSGCIDLTDEARALVKENLTRG